MRFSIREMLALTFLVALGMLAWRTKDNARRNEAHVAQLRAEVRALEIRTRQKQPALHQAILHTREEFESLHAMRERSIAHFDVLRQKYSTMEWRGTDVLSIRRIPALQQIGSGPTPVVFRLFVPEERPLWLKFGVHEHQGSGHSSRSLDDDFDLLNDSPFNASGPFEVRLPSGDQTLEIAIGSASEGSLPLVITVDDKLLLRSAFVSDDVTGTGSSYSSAPSQLDFSPHQDPPWLLTAHMSLRTSGKTTSKTHAFSVWLSDHTSNFASFPGK